MASNQKTERIQNTKYAPPPPGIPLYGSGTSGSVCFLGRANYSTALQTKNFIFGINREDRARHMYAVGKSGSGKSKFLELLLRQDIANREGVCLIDPYGEITENILKFIPENRVRDCVLIDCEDKDFPISINPFFEVSPTARHQYLEFLVRIFKEYIGEAWHSESEYVVRHLFQALLDYPHASFFGVLLMLTNDDYRREVLEYIQDPVTKSFWLHEFEEKRAFFEERVILPMKTRLDRIFFDPVARLLFAQTNHTLDFVKAMEERKIVLIKLPKGTVSDEVVSLIGSLLLASIRAACLTRRATPDSLRQVYLYIDEFQNIQTSMLPQFFSEATKARLALTITHRYLGQLSDTVRTAIFGNVGNVVVFRVSGEDAIRLRSEMAPVFEAKDMLNLGTREFYIKMTIRGEVYDPFSGEVLKVFPPQNNSDSDAIRAASRSKYAIPRVEAEKLFYRELGRYSGGNMGNILKEG
jgi:hypothetical protein